MKCADLHIHTNYSDSTLTPEEVIEKAVEQEIDCIGIADHDTPQGIVPTIKAAEGKNIEVLAGIELSSETNKKDIHILGYLFDYENKDFLEHVYMMQDTRVGRMEKMIAILETLGVDNITLEEVAALAESNSLGRPHLAMILVKKGWVKTIQKAFDKYLAEGAPAYVPKFKQTPTEAIQFIKKHNGVAVLAHPMLTRVDELIPGMVEAGLDGLETFYPSVSSNAIEYYKGLAKKYNLVTTGGSDAHGEGKDHAYIGSVKLDYVFVEQLRERRNKWCQA